MSDHPLHRFCGVRSSGYPIVCVTAVLLLVATAGPAFGTPTRSTGSRAPTDSNQAVNSEAAPAEMPDLLDPDCPPPHVLAGRVIYPGPDGELLPVPDARVSLFRCLHHHHDPVLIDFVGTGDEGGFHFEDVPGGHYLMSAAAPGFLPQIKQARVHPAAPSAYRFILRPVPQAEFGAVEGQVLGVTPSGEEVPLPGAQVTLFVGELPVRETSAREDGSYALGRLLPGEYRLGARAHGFMPAETMIAIEVDEVTAHTFLLEPAPPPAPGAIVGQVLGIGPDGEIVPPYAVVVLFAGPRPVAAAVANEEGFYEFDELRPERYHLVAFARGFIPDGAMVEVAPGEVTQQDFLLDPLGPLPEACCLDDSGCEMLPAPVCEEIGGGPQGSGISCTPDLCNN